MNTVSKTSAYAFATEYVADLVGLSYLRIAPSAPLRSNHLIEVHEDPGHDYFRTAIVHSKRMPQYLSGEFLLDPVTANYLRFVPPVSFEDLPLPGERIAELKNISKHTATPSGGGTLIAFYGAQGRSQPGSVAASYAAADGASIEMSRIARAARREYDQEGRPMPRADMEAFRELAGEGNKS